MILVDPPVWKARGRLWSHLASDVSYDELHGFAREVGLHPYSYDGDHYDVPGDRYAEVVQAGASPCSTRELLGRVRAAGLRFHKRRGERPVAAIPDGRPELGLPHRVDLVLSDRETPPETTVEVAVVVTDDRGRLLLLSDPRTGAWRRPGGGRATEETPPEAAVRHLRDQVGFRPAAADLRACGYERTLAVPPEAGTPESARVSHVAVYRWEIASPGGPVGDPVAGWFDEAAGRARCGQELWWPMVERLWRAAGSQSR